MHSRSPTGRVVGALFRAVVFSDPRKGWAREVGSARACLVAVQLTVERMGRPLSCVSVVPVEAEYTSTAFGPVRQD